MNQITTRLVVIHLGGKPVEIPKGQPLPGGVTARQREQLAAMGAIAESADQPAAQDAEFKASLRRRAAKEPIDPATHE